MANDIPIGSLENGEPISVGGGYVFLGTVSNDSLFGAGQSILNHYNPDGTNSNPNTDYLKYVHIDGKVLFVAKNHIKTFISWDTINGGDSIQNPLNVNSAVYGAMEKNINGRKYRIRLMKGCDTNPGNSIGGEWSSLILGLHNQNTSLYNAEYFHTAQSIASWTQEEYTGIPECRVQNGYLSIDALNYDVSSYGYFYSGWRPVLEFTPNISYLLKSNGYVHSLKDGKLVYTNIINPTQSDFETYGMKVLEGYEIPISTVQHIMVEGEVLGSGKVFRKTINRDQFKINSLDVK